MSALAEYILPAVGSRFAIIDPPALVPVFLAMTPHDTPAQWTRTASTACAVADLAETTRRNRAARPNLGTHPTTNP